MAFLQAANTDSTLLGNGQCQQSTKAFHHLFPGQLSSPKQTFSEQESNLEFRGANKCNGDRHITVLDAAQ